MAEIIQQLENKIASSKSKIRNFAQFVDGYVADRDSPSLEKRLHDIDREFQEYGKYYPELDALVDDPNLGDTWTEYEDVFYTAYGKASSFIKELKRQDSTTTKIRVVVDGSAKTSSGTSLNDTLMVGPTIQHPVAASVPKRDIYVDDLLTGANTRREAACLRDDLTALLQNGGFPTRKWASKDPSLVPETAGNPSKIHMSLDPTSAIKTLGIHWNAFEDLIFYKVNPFDSSLPVTKRSILSQVAKLFDPLGLLGPDIVTAKIMIQLLWKAGVSWDESIPVEIHTAWVEFKEQLPLLSNVNFNRLTLQWIKTEPHVLKTFVSNRIAEIQGLSKSCEWRHVPTQDNPADLLSRGLTPQEFIGTGLWKHGPHWLSRDEKCWPQQKMHLSELPQKRKIIASPASIKTNLLSEDAMKRYSSLRTLKRVIAYVLRFTHNSNKKLTKQVGPITATELEAATRIIYRRTQSTTFAKEIDSLNVDGRVDTKGRLTPLKPFLDKQGILRVGGRLTYSDLPEESKHQVLLPSNHHITRPIIREEHEKLKHAGTQAILYSVREFYWPIDGRNVIRMIIHKCVRCFRAQPRGVDYIMGDLPQNRVSSSRPVLTVGVDYSGPLYIKENRFCNRNRVKVYVAIFVCISTKAVHLESVSDVTTETFIASLKSLFSRRGISKTIHFDNATNFVGASRVFTAPYKAVQSAEHNKTVQAFLTGQGITWNFIPPRFPHFGGLWEAAVKSVKHHLVRIVENTLLTFEQLETCIIEIEAILNSRPLSPMSPDPNDLQPLTPGHFLIGGPLTSFPQMAFTDTAPNRLSAWQHAQKLHQHFWCRWQKECLQQLTVRSKWHSKSPQGIQPGTIVIIREDNLPPLQWKLGQIVTNHPGPVGISRVATVKTGVGDYKRGIKKLCPLPVKHPPAANEQINSQPGAKSI